MSNEKILVQFQYVINLALTVLLMNTVGVVVLSVMSWLNVFNIFSDISFYVWLLITLVLWGVTIFTFKQADIKVNWKKG